MLRFFAGLLDITSVYNHYADFNCYQGFVSAGVQAYALGCTEEGVRMELMDIKASGGEIEGLRSYGGGTSLSFKVRSSEVSTFSNMNSSASVYSCILSSNVLR